MQPCWPRGSRRGEAAMLAWGVKEGGGSHAGLGGQGGDAGLRVEEGVSSHAGLGGKGGGRQPC